MIFMASIQVELVNSVMDLPEKDIWLFYQTISAEIL